MHDPSFKNALNMMLKVAPLAVSVVSLVDNHEMS